MRWTRKNIIEEIRRLKSAEAELNYSTIERKHLNLARAAAWHFGNWRGAVEAAGIDYESVGKYRRWNRERIVARIRELHAAKADLSWRAVSTRIDPPLAAAALRANGFANWREAITAAGLEIEDVARYRRWDDERVIAAVRESQKRGESVASKAVQSRDQPLFCAARRRFGSWDDTLQRAGIASQNRRARASKEKASSNAAPESARVLAPRGKAENKSVAVKSAARKAPAPKAATPSKAHEAPRSASTRTEKSAPSSAKSAARSSREETAAHAAKSKASTLQSGGAKSSAAKAGTAKADAKARAEKPGARKTAAPKARVDKTPAPKTAVKSGAAKIAAAPRAAKSRQS